MQGECAVIEPTCVDEFERQFGFVHTIPRIMILIATIQANDVINATTAVLEWQRSRRYILQEAVTTSLLQFLRNDERHGKVQNCARLCNFVRSRKNTYISKLMDKFSGDNYVFFQFVHY